MSKSPAESNTQQVERSSAAATENSRGAYAELASNAYSQQASGNLRGEGGSGAADQHLGQAKITDSAIEFGPPQDNSNRYYTDAKGGQHYQHRDQQGNVTEESVTNPDGSGQARQYGKFGERTETTWDKDHNRQITAYDANGRESSTEMRHSDGSTTRYENGKGGDHTYSHHDANGKLVEDSRFNGDGSGEARHFYEDGSQQTVRRDKDGSSHTFTYDKDGNLSTYEASWANGVKENFRANPDNSTYYSKKDPSGRMEEESLIKQDGTGERRLYPAEGGRIEQSWDKDVTTTTAYDKNGQRVN